MDDRHRRSDVKRWRAGLDRPDHGLVRDLSDRASGAVHSALATTRHADSRSRDPGLERRRADGVCDLGRDLGGSTEALGLGPDTFIHIRFDRNDGRGGRGGSASSIDGDRWCAMATAEDDTRRSSGGATTRPLCHHRQILQAARRDAIDAAPEQRSSILRIVVAPSSVAAPRSKPSPPARSSARARGRQRPPAPPAWRSRHRPSAR